MSKAGLCIATTQNHARNITPDSLKSAGFNHDDISVLLADKTETSDFGHEQTPGLPTAPPSARAPRTSPAPANRRRGLVPPDRKRWVRMEPACPSTGRAA